MYCLTILQVRHPTGVSLDKNQGVNRDVFLSADSRVQSISLPFPASRGLPHSLACSHLPPSSKPATLQYCISLTFPPQPHLPLSISRKASLFLSISLITLGSPEQPRILSHLKVLNRNYICSLFCHIRQQIFL